ncbi:Hypothetical protein CAP_0577 [Chondromyces apiculatus DSM 436]|uniref:Protein kinase domain-containing protein n=1 Tax=Chondromyces apiculatus DSM 436 TaxID=1192034 RepID=A0A017TCU8_9BACT|nr:Hypothetical protein CAP_0577 [Chondromyces apiculatus DSM 436]
MSDAQSPGTPLASGVQRAGLPAAGDAPPPAPVHAPVAAPPPDASFVVSIADSSDDDTGQRNTPTRPFVVPRGRSGAPPALPDSWKDDDAERPSLKSLPEGAPNASPGAARTPSSMPPRAPSSMPPRAPQHASPGTLQRWPSSAPHAAPPAASHTPPPSASQRVSPSQPPDVFGPTIASNPPPQGSPATSIHARPLPRPPQLPVSLSISPSLPRPPPPDADGSSSPAQTLRSAAPAPQPPTEGRILSGRYRLFHVLGTGGMGQVFRGEHLRIGTPVAIKTMHAHLAVSPEDRRRFLREARAASLLRHPNVVQVLDSDEDNGLAYLVMEFVDGSTLGDWLRALPAPPPLAEVARIFTMILSALVAAHAQGVVHRDLKPDNILLAITEGSEQPIAKVTDFGLAHVDDPQDTGPTLTQRDMVAGTPEYMSPEQCRSLQVGPSADLYAAGCILTVLLQRRPPFSGGAPIEIFTKHLFSVPPPLVRPLGAEPVPPLLERLRLDLLAKHPDRRPATATEALTRLREAMSPEATASRLPDRKDAALAGTREARAPAWSAQSSTAAGHPTPVPGAPVVVPTDPAGSAIPAADGNLGNAATIPSVRRPAGTPAASPEAADIAYLHLDPAAPRLIDDPCATGLEALGLRPHTFPTLAALAAAPLPVLLLDAGANVDAACAFLRDLATASPRTRAIVCVDGLGAERMTALVAAGAADVTGAPVTPDVLGRKLWRVVRRGR